jgi:uncharacterized membrane protein YGL010W
MPRKTADQWFAEYGESHQKPANELIHWLCVPVIFFSVIGLIWSIPRPMAWVERLPWFDWALPGIALALLFYVRLSPLLSLGLFAFMTFCYAGVLALAMYAPWPVWQICLILFCARVDRAVHRPPDRGQKAVLFQGRAVSPHRPGVAAEPHL